MPAGRVLIAFDDGPLVASPTWTCLDDSVTFPANFVSGYDLVNGRQTLLSQTGTGTATVYINDFQSGLFDPRNTGSPYYNKLDGRQIQLQLYDPYRGVWEPQFRGHIDEVAYTVSPESSPTGVPMNVACELQCVDIFDYLAGFGLTPGLAGVRPPSGAEDGVYYAQPVGEVDDRIIELLADVGLDSTRYVVFSGNVRPMAVKYDPDHSALAALRDACDAEFPFIANMYVDRFGRFVFHGRYGRFDPAGLISLESLSTAVWDFHTWKVGDGAAVAGDPSRAQTRVLDYGRGRPELINVAVCYPQNTPAHQMPSQVYADSTSITNYGTHAAPPMSDLIIQYPVYDSLHGGPTTRYTETLAFAELLVKNQKDPREWITALNLKSLSPGDSRASATWGMLSRVDVSDIVNVKVGYPNATGFTGGATVDDYFVEGRQMRVRPLQPAYDYVELDLEVSPRVWSSDPHGVFPVLS